MKAKMFILLSLCLDLVACDPYRCFPPPAPTAGEVMVVKFKQPEYKEHILVASPKKREPGLSLVPTTRYWIGYSLPPIVENLYRQAPYTELLDDYLLIDWKYALPIKRVLKEKASIIINTWEEMDELEKWWPFENMYVKYPFDEIISVPLDSLNVYNGGLEYPQLNHITYDSYNDYLDYSNHTAALNDIQKNRPATDSSFVEYKNVLNKMIQEGVLGEYGKYIYKQ